MSPPAAALSEPTTTPCPAKKDRAWERHECGLETSCQPIAARNDRDIHWPATIKDISVMGVGLVVGRRFERGAGMAIALPASDTHSADTLLVRVQHTTALPAGRWLLGCSLISELGEDEIEEILRMGRAGHADAAPEQAGPAGTASAEPFVVPGVLFQLLQGETPAEPLLVRHLYLKGTWPLPPGTTLRIRVRGGGSGWRLVRVRSCEQRAGRWTLSYSVLA
jgi:hypothetical protein